MSTIPNPWFTSSAEVVMPSVDTAAASPVHCPGPVDAAATEFDELEIPLEELTKRGFDVDAFMEAIEPLPLFLQAPIDVMSVLAGYAR